MQPLSPADRRLPISLFERLSSLPGGNRSIDCGFASPGPCIQRDVYRHGLWRLPACALELWNGPRCYRLVDEQCRRWARDEWPDLPRHRVFVQLDHGLLEAWALALPHADTTTTPYKAWASSFFIGGSSTDCGSARRGSKPLQQLANRLPARDAGLASLNERWRTSGSEASTTLAD